MRKLGILSHSFDANWTPKVKNPENMYNYNNDYINCNDNENSVESNNNIAYNPYKVEIQKVESQGSGGTTVFGSQKILSQSSNLEINNKF